MADELIHFENTYASELEELVLDWQPAEVPDPTLVVLNSELAAELGIDAERLDSAEGAAVMVGNTVPPSSRPVAMAYAGHQFGGYSPRLGDGRAVLLGEIVDPSGERHDVHLKGSGRTPFARGGDGKAVLGPMLREFLLAEAMHALGVSTTRALAVAATGEEVVREQMVPGAILVRVASSHLRVGTFEYTARLDDEAAIRRLADFSIRRHYPEAADAESPYLAFFEAVVDAQARLVASWMQLGFIHGVLNTDNVTISGEGIDYGPCAFMDHFDPATVFSSIDRGGRYAYGQQPIVSTWNLTRLAETLVSLIDDDFDAAAEPLMALLNGFHERHNTYWLAGMGAKLGLGGDHDAVEGMIPELLKLLEVDRIDYTGTFRALSASLRGDEAALPALFASGDLVSMLDWTDRWRAHVEASDRDLVQVADEMDGINPIYIPRNHLVEEALVAATAGDLDPFRQLLDVVTDPFAEREGHERYAEPGPDEFQKQFQTFCGT